MLLHSGESRLRSAYAVMEGDSPEHAQGPGVLYLTTHRLVFESSHPRGAMRRLVQGAESRTVLDAALALVRNVEVRRPRIGRERLVVELNVGRPAFDVLDPDAWAAAIAVAKRNAPGPTGAWSTHLIERQVVKIRCRYCGTLGNEVDGRCPTCGAPL
jgi:Zn finger protein HypA/HybF involved in hydrogenase expression